MDYDVVVAGASAAGLRAARLLAEAGLRTALFDRRTAAGEDADRTWIVTPHLEEVLGERPVPAVVHETDVMRLSSPSVTTDVQLDAPDLIVERSRLFDFLGRAAADAGAHLHFDRRVNTVREAGDALEVVLHDGGEPLAVRTRHLVAADGVRSTVARSVGLSHPEAVPLVQALVPLPPDWDPRRTKVWFRPSRTPYFYWLIPQSKDRGALGLIADSRSDARALLDGFLSERGLEPLGYQASLVALHEPRRPLEARFGGGRSRVVLVGDAAGHVKVTTVGGVVTGLWGAEAAARALVHEKPYASELRTLRRELYLHDAIRWVMNRFGRREYDALLRLLNSPLRRLIQEHSRDRMAPRTVALFAAQPRLIGLGLRALVRPT